jgi:hypothetical protein
VNVNGLLVALALVANAEFQHYGLPSVSIQPAVSGCFVTGPAFDYEWQTGFHSRRWCYTFIDETPTGGEHWYGYYEDTSAGMPVWAVIFNRDGSVDEQWRDDSDPAKKYRVYFVRVKEAAK